MSLSRAWTPLWICFIFGLRERLYPAHVLISLWCDSDNKNFFTFQNLCGYFSFVHFGYQQNLLINYIPLPGFFLNICSMHIGPKELARFFFLCFSASSTKSTMAAKILCHSLELELLHGFVLCLVQSKKPTPVVCWLVFRVIMIIKLFFSVLGF